MNIDYETYPLLMRSAFTNGDMNRPLQIGVAMCGIDDLPRKSVVVVIDLVDEVGAKMEANVPGYASSSNLNGLLFVYLDGLFRDSSGLFILPDIPASDRFHRVDVQVLNWTKSPEISQGTFRLLSRVQTPIGRSILKLTRLETVSQ